MTKYPELLDGNPPMEEKRGLEHFIVRRLPSIAFPLLVAFLAITMLWRFVIITVPSGHVGVLWKRFNTFDLYCWCFAGRGTMLNPQQLRGEGLHLIWPWDKFYIYNLRLQSNEATYNAISREGVIVTAQINTRFQLLNNSIAVLHKFIGPNYVDTVISPEVGSQARQVISQYSAQEVYTSRELIQEKLRENVRRGLGANLNKLVQPEAMEQPDPKNYNNSLQYSIQVLDTPGPQYRIAACHRRRDQPADRAVLLDRGISPSRRSRGRGIQAQADRGERHRRIPEDRKPRDFRFLSALARDRGHPGTCTIAEFEGGGDRRRQGRPADHSWKCRWSRRPGGVAERRRGTCQPTSNPSNPQVAPQDGPSPLQMPTEQALKARRQTRRRTRGRRRQRLGVGPGTRPVGAAAMTIRRRHSIRCRPGRACRLREPEKPTNFNCSICPITISVLSRIIGTPRQWRRGCVREEIGRKGMT